MRIHSSMLAILLIATPAAAQERPELGARTRDPQSHVPALAPGQDDMAEAIAAADAFPLGSQRNPIRVGGPAGERAYLARLRCADGTAPRVGRRVDGGIGGFGTIIASYALDCGEAAPGQAGLAFDMYHAEHVENRAPPGFSIQPH
ncbi:MAG: hypothetical protein ACT4OE_02155 [Sphingosinicella sp.]